ncbi:DNA primase [Bacillus thuringiensis serovar silo]|uniref:toprim domain-containing protein n=1 Tax=Bacillus thuringiensis TaxID=1428 RepID=UPI000A367851|nr:toprim domain-containing protein [Bacillus thuringiensis]MED3275418.1 toprim domain-containing protein [Bacillus thuringiensis]OTW55292.1 DNA primase [Bacillus thuringiensis serovar silo]OTW74276.1 DNA primase [Bacillus thuringiensis serovar toguchini]
MAIISIRGRDVDVDIEKELDDYSWSRAKWSADRLIACSPFRYDSSPSFYVYLQDTATAFAGSWGDSGGGGEHQKGHFTQLMSFLRDCSEEEVIEYLLEEYASDWDGESKLEIDLTRLKMKEEVRGLPMELIEGLTVKSEYLYGRGVSYATQEYYTTVYDEVKQLVMFPYLTANGRLAALKKRRTDSKMFFYEGGGVPMRELVFGIDLAHRDCHKIAIITEAEIDAMYGHSVTGILGLGVGTSSLTKEKASVIRRSPVEELIIASDNDKAGEKLRKQIESEFGGELRLYRIEFPDGCKDLNDMSPQQLRDAIANKKALVPALFNVA